MIVLLFIYKFKRYLLKHLFSILIFTYSKYSYQWKQSNPKSLSTNRIIKKITKTKSVCLMLPILLPVSLPSYSKHWPLSCTFSLTKLFHHRQFFLRCEHLYHCSSFKCSWLLDCEECDWQTVSGIEMVEWFWLKRQINMEIR